MKLFGITLYYNNKYYWINSQDLIKEGLQIRSMQQTINICLDDLRQFNALLSYEPCPFTLVSPSPCRIVLYCVLRGVSCL